jgi:hypothetical protein
MRETAFAKCRCDQRQQVVAERDDDDNQGGEQRTARDAVAGRHTSADGRDVGLCMELLAGGSQGRRRCVDGMIAV